MRRSFATDTSQVGGRARPARDAATRRAPAFSLASALVLLAAASLGGCGASPWEQPSSPETSAQLSERGAERSFFARDARLSTWIDRRASGSEIHHDMLVVGRPSAARPAGGGDAFVISTRGMALDRKIHDVLDERIPVRPGSRANFALGTLVPVRIERVAVDGRRELVAEARVSFLELER